MLHLFRELAMYPELVFPAGYQVECLHGRHRIQAAKELGLDWWTVDLYLAGRLVLSGYPGVTHANQLSLLPLTSGGYGIRAQVEITLEAGVLVPHQLGTPSRTGRLPVLPL